MASRIASAPGSPAPPAAGHRTGLGVLRYRDFRLLWTSSVVSNIGTWMHIVTQGWLMYQLTGAPLSLGLIGLTRAVPLLTFPLWGGVVADRIPRVRILYVTQTTAMALAAGLATVTVLGFVQPWHILLFSFLNASVSSFDNPARQALIPDLVPAEDLISANSLNSWAFTGATLVGPALAAGALPFIGIGGSFYVNAASFGAVLIALKLLHVRGEVLASGTGRQNLIEGLRYVRGNPAVLSLILMTALVSLLGRSYTQLMPVFAQDFLGLNVEGMSLLYTAAGAGTTVGLLGLILFRNPPRKGLLAACSGLGCAAAVVLFALSRIVVISVVLVFLIGFMLIVFTTAVTALLQILAPPHLRGRAMSVYQLSWQGLEYVGVLLVGGLATLWGTAAVVAGAAVALAIALLAIIARRSDLAFAELK
ncbi:MAG TPA: MFS transporter [Chloroflexota bacterium]|nr:MFS transporter [Chloroflexota bacterium]